MEEQKPIKAAKLVVEAIRFLKSEKGFTPKEIVSYISSNHKVSDRMVKCIYTSLKRGAEYGILRTKRGRYMLKMSPTLLALGGDKQIVPEPEEAKKSGGGSRSLCKKRKPRMSLCKKRTSRAKKRSCCARKQSRRSRKMSKRSRGRRHSRSSRSRRLKQRCTKRSSRSHSRRRRSLMRRQRSKTRKCATRSSRRSRMMRRSKKQGKGRRRAKCRC